MYSMEYSTARNATKAIVKAIIALRRSTSHTILTGKFTPCPMGLFAPSV